MTYPSSNSVQQTQTGRERPRVMLRLIVCDSVTCGQQTETVRDSSGTQRMVGAVTGTADSRCLLLCDPDIQCDRWILTLERVLSQLNLIHSPTL